MNDDTRILLLTAAFVMAMGTASTGQTTLTGEIRPKFEYRHGYKTLRDSTKDAALFVSQRTRLKLGYSGEKLKAGIALQDVRTWGDEELAKDMPSIGLYEAWGEIELTKKIGLKVGRQEIIYDNDRLLGNFDWGHTGRTHDAVLLKYSGESMKLDLGGAWNQNSESTFGTLYKSTNYKFLSFLWLSKKFSDRLTVTLNGITDGFTPSDTSNILLTRVTGGGNIHYTKNSLSLKGFGYLQAGKNNTYNDIFAWFGSLSAAYKINKITVTAGCDYLSGDDATDTADKKVNTFNTLYATNHKFYGHMDYFINIPSDTKNGGLVDSYFKIEYAYSEKTKAGLDFHLFRLANNVYDPKKAGSVLDKNLGNEIDLYVNSGFTKEINIKLGYSLLVAADSMEGIKGGDSSLLPSWGWVMITLKPEFLKP
jgi:hypothetical protein